MTKICCAAFDVDGTLLDSQETNYAAAADVIRELTGREIDRFFSAPFLACPAMTPADWCIRRIRLITLNERRRRKASMPTGCACLPM